MPGRRNKPRILSHCVLFPQNPPVSRCARYAHLSRRFGVLIQVNLLPGERSQQVAIYVAPWKLPAFARLHFHAIRKAKIASVQVSRDPPRRAGGSIRRCHGIGGCFVSEQYDHGAVFVDEGWLDIILHVRPVADSPIRKV